MLGRKIKLVGVGIESSGWSGKPYPNRHYLSGNLPGRRAAGAKVEAGAPLGFIISAS